MPHGEVPACDRSLHLDQSDFATQLDFILDRADVVPLSTALSPRAIMSRRPRIAITFDDAYRGAMTAGMDELRSRGLPGTVFVPPGLLGASGFWWDMLASTEGPTEKALRDYCLNDLGGNGDRIIAWAESQGRPLSKPPFHAQPVSEDELLAQKLPDKVTLGSHTFSHANLATLSPSEKAAELSTSRSWLSTRSDHYVNYLSYPYGRYDSDTAAEASRHYLGCVRVDGGAVEYAGPLLRASAEIPRLNIPRGLTLDGFAIRMAGLI